MRYETDAVYLLATDTANKIPANMAGDWRVSSLNARLGYVSNRHGDYVTAAGELTQRAKDELLSYLTSLRSEGGLPASLASSSTATTTTTTTPPATTTTMPPATTTTPAGGILDGVFDFWSGLPTIGKIGIGLGAAYVLFVGQDSPKRRR